MSNDNDAVSEGLEYVKRLGSLFWAGFVEGIPIGCAIGLVIGAVILVIR